MNTRIRRLNADQKNIEAVFSKNPYICVLSKEGTPPEKYTFEFRVRGLVPDADGSFSVGSVHRSEVFLPLDYPRRPPFCRMITPIFHPNIAPEKICIGDHWSAGQSLAQLIIRIAEMICFQSYNIQSPLNAKAAAWTMENISCLPLQKIDLSIGL